MTVHNVLVCFRNLNNAYLQHAVNRNPQLTFGSGYSPRFPHGLFGTSHKSSATPANTKLKRHWLASFPSGSAYSCCPLPNNAHSHTRRRKDGLYTLVIVWSFVCLKPSDSHSQRSIRLRSRQPRVRCQRIVQVLLK